MSRRLFLCAGEASGDLHAARLLSALRRRMPELEAFGMGGDEMTAAGFDRLYHSSEVSVVGLVEVLKILRRARQVFHGLLEEVDRRRPDAAVLVDFPDFNLRLARKLEARGVPVVYYISPQVWAWRRRRVKAIADTVHRMLVLFPFEEEFYAEHGVEVIHVGHPLVDEVPEGLPQAWDGDTSGLGASEPYRLALLPGSRSSEIDALLPVMLAAAERLAAEVPLRVRLIRAPTIPRARLETALAESGVTARGVELEIAEGDRFTAIADSHLALCASGTATLEVGMLGTPLLVCYKLAPWTYLAARLLVRLPHVALVNLVLEERVAPELLQGRAEPETIAAEARALLGDRGRVTRMRRKLAGVRPKLGEGGASERAADEVARWLRGEGG